MTSSPRLGVGPAGRRHATAPNLRRATPERSEAKLRVRPEHHHPPLRLVGTDPAPHPAPHTPAQPATPITHAHDPRWVLAVRAAEQLEGALLAPEKRQRLIRLGRVMGLTAFDCNLVIAIVQDQARRGHAADYCPTAAVHQLQLVPVPRHATVLARLRQRPALLVAGLLTTMLLLELALLTWLF
ncbi:MAG: hypothetical protein ACODAQ_03805 [Phycisphaeraceae bacterium]